MIRLIPTDKLHRPPSHYPTPGPDGTIIIDAAWLSWAFVVRVEAGMDRVYRAAGSEVRYEAPAGIFDAAELRLRALCSEFGPAETNPRRIDGRNGCWRVEITEDTPARPGPVARMTAAAKRAIPRMPPALTPEPADEE